MYPDPCNQNQSGVVCWSNAFFKIHEWLDVKPSLTKNQLMFLSACKKMVYLKSTTLDWAGERNDEKRDVYTLHSNAFHLFCPILFFVGPKKVFFLGAYGVVYCCLSSTTYIHNL